MANSGRYDQSVTRTKLYITRMVGQGKSNAALQAKERLAVGMAMDPINVTGTVRPLGGMQAARFEKAQDLGLRQWMGVRPAKDLDPCGERFVRRRVFDGHNLGNLSQGSD